MSKFQKKPVMVNAIPVDELLLAFANDWSALPVWAKDAYNDGTIRAITSSGFTVGTLEGPLEASLGDILIRGIKGELYPCKPDIFGETYEAVDQPAGKDMK